MAHCTDYEAGGANASVRVATLIRRANSRRWHVVQRHELGLREIEDAITHGLEVIDHPARQASRIRPRQAQKGKGRAQKNGNAPDTAHAKGGRELLPVDSPRKVRHVANVVGDGPGDGNAGRLRLAPRLLRFWFRRQAANLSSRTICRAVRQLQEKENVQKDQSGREPRLQESAHRLLKRGVVLGRVRLPGTGRTAREAQAAQETHHWHAIINQCLRCIGARRKRSTIAATERETCE